MKLSVVVVNYNTRDLLRDCLTALQRSTQQAEIIVVDNASTDGSAEVAAAEFPTVKLLAQPGNTWFCGGNNTGTAAASGEYVLLLNPDTVVQPDTLAEMVTFMDAHPDYAGATIQLRYPDGTIQRTCSRIPTYPYLLVNHTPLGWLFPGWRARLNAHHWYDGFKRDTPRDVEVLPGSCLLMRRGDLWLNDNLRLYFPEDDLARRFVGRRFRFLTGSYITHREKSATQNWLAARIYFRDMLTYTRQHHGVFGAALLWLLSRPLWLGMWARQRIKKGR